MATVFDPSKHPRAGSGRFTETLRGELAVNLEPSTEHLWQEHEDTLQAAGRATLELLAARLHELGFASLTAGWVEDPDNPNLRACNGLVRPDGSFQDPDEDRQYDQLDKYLADLTSGRDLLGFGEDEPEVTVAAAAGDVEALTAVYTERWAAHRDAQLSALNRSWDELRSDVLRDRPGAKELVVDDLGDEFRVWEVGAVAVMDAAGERHELTPDEQDAYGIHLSRLTGYEDYLPYDRYGRRRTRHGYVDLTATHLPTSQEVDLHGAVSTP